MTDRNQIKFFLLFLLSVLSITSTAYCEFISTFPSWNSTSSIGPINGGPGHRRAFGQTIRTDYETALLEFKFYIEGQVGTTLRAYVMQWNVDRTMGPVLFESDVISASVGLKPVNIATGGVRLLANTDYVLMLDAGDTTQNTGGFRVGITSGIDSYLRGGFVLSRFSATTFGELGTEAWDTNYEGIPTDAAFSATFSNVPEPNTGTLVIVGALCFLLARVNPRTATIRLNGL